MLNTPPHKPLARFPFRGVLDLRLLIEFWRERAARGAPLEVALAQQVLDAVAAAPELTGPITDPSMLAAHGSLLAELFSAAFPRAIDEETFGAALAPFSLEPVHATAGFRRQRLEAALAAWVTTPEITASLALNVYNGILRRFYGSEVDLGQPFILESPDADTGLDRFYRLTIDSRFVDIVRVGDLPALSDEQIGRLLTDCTDLERWQDLLPSDRFAFQGVLLIQAVEITQQQALAALTRELLRGDGMNSESQIEHLQHWLRTLLRKPDLQLGLISLHTDDIGQIEDAHPMGRSLLLSTGCAPECRFRSESFYAQALQGRRLITVRDLQEPGRRTGFEHHLMQLGLRNLLIAPLQLQDELVGLLELGSSHAGDLNLLNSRELDQVLALFSTAMKRALEEEEIQLQAVIKQQYTAVHPSVEWRFRQAAHRYLHSVDEGRPRAVEPIVFSDVYALYGLSDIRGSSAHRAEAIQQDLLQQLAAAADVLHAANRANPLPVISELAYRVGRFSTQVAERLNSGDEVRVHEFLKGEIETLFDQLGGFGEEVRARVQAYRDAIDPRLGVLYRRRKAFEDSVTLINTTIAEFLEEHEVHAQRMFPHYFEKYKTDGVDYNIYIGGALQEDGRFEPLYLRNMRLWQLMLMCGVVWKLSELEPKLPMPLGVAHLVLAQEAAISIRFRADEKKFDVDGAYNVRYEIVKKRIDKARVRGTREQLTQPGRVAIVYAQPKQAIEYRQYIEYLQAAGYLEPEVEELELEDLQGVRGLAALRVTVTPRRPLRVEALAPASRTARLVEAN